MADDEANKIERGTHSVPYVYWLLGVLFVVVFTWRMQGVTQWPMPFHPMLQYENALNVRYLTLSWKGDTASDEEKHWLKGYSGRSKGIGLVEVLTCSVCYHLSFDWMWVSGIFTCLAWMVSAWFLFHIVHRQLHSPVAAFTAVCFFVLHPFTFVVSRSFQHEATQMLGFMMAWWMLVREDFFKFNIKYLFLAFGLGALLCFKPGIGWIPFCFIHLAYGVQRYGWSKTLRLPMLYLVPMLALIPSMLWIKFIMPSDELHQWK